MEYQLILSLLKGRLAEAAPLLSGDLLGNPPKTAETITDLVKYAQNYISIFAGILAFGVIIWGAALYILSGGDPDKAKQAKKVLTYGIGGVILILAANALIKVFIIILGGTA